MHDSDESLNKAYNAHKKANPAPHSIKTAILSSNTRRNQKSAKTRSWYDWATAYAATFAIALLVGVLGFHHWSQHIWQPSTSLEVTTVMHGYTDNDALADSTESDLRAKQALGWQAYQQQQLASTIIHNNMATLVKADNDWVLQDCHQNLIKISPQLITKLLNQHRLPAQAKPGDALQIAFNQAGFIVEIAAAGVPLQCG